MNNSRNTKIDKNIVSAKIKYYRTKNGWSYQKMSDKLMFIGIDIHKQSIYEIEKGLRTVVDYELCGFAKCFNITVNDLISDFFDTLDK